MRIDLDQSHSLANALRGQGAELSNVSPAGNKDEHYAAMAGSRIMAALIGYSEADGHANVLGSISSTKDLIADTLIWIGNDIDAAISKFAHVDREDARHIGRSAAL
ncbi:hypothetical protein JK358_35910 [Nocardia sp. 2]|uniref:Uncharacterized protein n=1 Tax=Nocardia acididurans TaxID=2802282 RepID=A0ABS1MGR2_9NOCA|nr:hypothetical protein [Nocardia acididurans]MBL1079802.1 hypothetical protein [Nocardia acididurans]